MPRSSWWPATSTGPATARELAQVLELASRQAAPATPVARLQGRGLLRVPPLHARRAHHHQGQADEAALAHDRGAGARRQALHLPRRRRLLPHPVRRADVQAEGRRVPRDQERQGPPPRPAPAQGQGARLQGRHLGQPAARRRGLDRPHARRREGEDQDGGGLRRGRRARAEGLEAHRRQCLRGRVGHRAQEPQEGRHHRRGDRARPRRLGGAVQHPAHEKVEAFTMRYRVPVPAEGEAKLNYRVRVRF